ncbi:MAG: universal stress protein [Planctomycetota bacterium]|nr:universal stress protein [Planctomycetota bacterium]
MFKRILHPTDLAPENRVPFVHALKIALEAKGRLEVIHVDPHPEMLHWNQYPHVRETLEKWGLLPEPSSFTDLEQLGMGVRKVNITGTNPVTSILAELSLIPEDLMVLGTHGRSGMDRLIHGEVGSKLSRLSRTMSLFIPLNCDGFVDLRTGTAALSRIVVPVDKQIDPRPALQAALELVAILGGQPVTISLLHVGTSAAALGNVDLSPRPGITWETDLRGGDVIGEIVAAAEDPPADLIALTTAGRHGFLDMLRGSTTERLLQQARCPVLAVPAPVPASP